MREFKSGQTHPGYICVGSEDIWHDDPRWPGDKVAAEITRLYYACAEHELWPHYDRRVAAILAEASKSKGASR